MTNLALRATAARLATLVALAAGLGGCMVSVPQPVATTPNPAPPRGYRVECSTIPLGLPSVYGASCTPVVPPAPAVIRAKG